MAAKHLCLVAVALVLGAVACTQDTTNDPSPDQTPKPQIVPLQTLESAPSLPPRTPCIDDGSPGCEANACCNITSTCANNYCVAGTTTNPTPPAPH
jgi:hypothetical protein